MLKGLFGRSIEEKARHQKWAFSAKKSELSKRTKAGHKQTSGKRQEY
ncbi:MAG: hypothetical protein HY544_04380 [Candidatus Diapherotrites archaeon]|uniref:Uncharacterized protein n=1 Tax=Candidatus Iainarchaeum sp. TaxID=3101447 RepID=A0A8T3YKE7_9ARCH|nr:hypothetical protein [Candidatus Diapherotrites archaeon]